MTDAAAAADRARDGSILVVNPSSGADGGVDDLVAEARRWGIEVVLLEPDRPLEDLLAPHLGGATTVGMAGGDGSLGPAAGLCLAHDLDLVCIPFGTRNHFARDLGLDRRDPIGSLAAFRAQAERRIDVGTVGDRVFMNNVALGVYAEAIDDDDYRDAKLRTTWRAAMTALDPDAPPHGYRVPGPDGVAFPSPFLTVIANNCYDLSSPLRLGVRPALDEGVLQVTVVDPERGRDVASIAVTAVHDDAAAHERVEQWTTTVITIDADEPELAVGIDGEAATLVPPVTLRIAPRALRVQVPVDTLPPPPDAAAADAPGRTTAR